MYVQVPSCHTHLHTYAHIMHACTGISCPRAPPGSPSCYRERARPNGAVRDLRPGAECACAHANANAHANAHAHANAPTARCATYAQELSVAVTFTDWDFFHYPFDHHVISINISIGGAVIYGCEAIGESPWYACTTCTACTCACACAMLYMRACACTHVCSMSCSCCVHVHAARACSMYGRTQAHAHTRASTTCMHMHR